MSLFGGSNTGTQTTTQTPWTAMQPYLKQVGSESQDLYNSNTGFNPFPNSTYVPMSGQTKSALGDIWGTAQGDTTGMSGWDALSPFVSGSQTLGMEGAYDNMWDQGPTALSQYGTGIASGANGIDTNPMASLSGGYGQVGGQYGALGGQYGQLAGDYNSLGGAYGDLGARSGNDAWNAATDINAGKIATDVNRLWDSSGRYGSAGQTNDLVSQLGDYRTQATAQGFNDAYNREMGALGGQFNTLGGRQGALGGQFNTLGGQMNALGGQFNVASGVAGLQNQNIQNRLSAAGQLSGEQQTRFGNNMNTLGAITGMRQQDYSNQLGAIGQIPAIQQSMYTPGQIGAAYDDAAARKKQAAVDKWTQTQQAPWSRLSAYSQMVGGPGQGGQSTTTVTPPSNPFGSAIGGALAGGQMFGWPGALAGGGLGLLAGA